jgi:hypothetical protein
MQSVVMRLWLWSVNNIHDLALFQKVDSKNYVMKDTLLPYKLIGISLIQCNHGSIIFSKVRKMSC